MGKFVSFLTELSRADLAQVGGKAANLGEMTRAGFRVPAGFSVKSSAFEAFLDASGLVVEIDQIAAQIDFHRLADVEEKTARIRSLLCTAQVPSDVASEIRVAYEALQEGDEQPLVAVRSSVGTRDLSRSSFPGQMDTYHNVHGPDSVLASVRECWASVWSARAAATFHARGIHYRAVIIAPLVQRMVPSEISGVLFTVHPTTGSTDEIVLNAAFGLGEAVVSGSLSPDQYVLSKKTFGVLSRQVGHKPFKLERDASKPFGNRKVALQDSEANRECLTSGQLVELTRLGMALEEHFGAPQDVEWAYFDGTLQVLQSRRVSGLGAAGAQPALREWISEFDTKIKEPPDTHSSANISEVMPGVLTPISLDAVKSCDYAFWRINHEVGLFEKPFPPGEVDYLFIGLFYGRLHLNMSTFARILARIPGAAAADIDRPIRLDPNETQPESAKWSLGILPFLAKVVYRSLLLRLRLPDQLRRATSLVHGRITENREQDFNSMGLPRFAELLDRNSRENREVILVHILNSQFAPLYYGLLRNITRRWFGDDTGAFAARLVTGLGTMESVKPGIGIYGLYRLVQQSPTLSNLFRETPSDQILVKIEKLQPIDSDCAAFRSRLSSFLREYGYRALSEAEIMAPSWEEDPSFVLHMIRNYLLVGRVEDPLHIAERQRRDREQALAEVRSRLGFLKRTILHFVLTEAQTFLLGRENAKALTIKGLDDLKKTIRALNRCLLEQGSFTDPDDIYFLTLSELTSYCRGRQTDVHPLIVRRKMEHERNKAVVLPETFTGRPKPVEAGQDTIPRTRILKGLPVSPGRVTGPARVILDPRRDPPLQDGEILVCPVTDTGWTPLFIMAKGLVVDVGGLLSHGSIVAREYGIPGVLNVLVGTKIIRTGQRITVDGAMGEVYLHED